MKSSKPSSSPKEAPQAPAQDSGRCDLREPFVEWLRRNRTTVGVTTYLASKLLLLGVKDDGKQCLTSSGSPRCMGASASPDGQTVWICSQHQLWRLEKSPLPPTAPFDAEYAARMAFTVGDIDGHDVAILDDGPPVFVSARYSCLARPSQRACFELVWKPPFISRLAAEDRCHLNGLALREGRPAFCTCVAETDHIGGWREYRDGGGVVLSVPDGEVVCRGLSMPHSPRWHNGQLYLINSGAGEFGRLDLAAGKFEPIAFLPGYGRGLHFADGKAWIGLSDCRENRTFQGLPLDENLKKHGAESRCAVFSVDLATGETTEMARFSGIIRELYDVFMLPGMSSPNVLALDQGLWHITEPA